MQPALALSGLLVALTVSVTPGDDNKVLYTAVVKDAVAEVRSGPSDDPKMYATNRLRQGTVVEVVGEREGGWLAIKPPAGSFSWINLILLERDNDRVWHVVAHDDTSVPVRIGSELINEKPTVEGARVARGSIVVAVGKEKVADDGKWLPIEPPPGELRYIKAEAVTRSQAVAQANAPPQATPPGSWDGQPPATRGLPPAQPTVQGPAPLPPATNANADPLWTAAQQDEQAGRSAEAEQKYVQLAQKYFNQNHDLAMQFCNRAHFLRERRYAAAAYQPTETRYAGTPGDGRVSPIPTNASGQQATFHVTSCPQQGQAESRSSPPGHLRLAARLVDCKRTYALESSQGQLLMYVAPQQGVDLEPYIDRNVELYGPLVYRMDLRAQYMLATQVKPLP
jgi:hypothetical protein